MRAIGLLFILAIGPLGCKTVHFQQTEVLKRQNSITMLKDRLDLAATNEVDVLAPIHFSRAQTLLDRAMKEAQGSEDPQAGSATADDGIKAIVLAEESAAASRTVLHEALDRRARAQAVHAHLLFEKDFNTLDTELSEAARAMENGNKKLGLEKNLDLATRYGNLEVLALKANISEIAEKAYEQALEASAQKLAPITLKSAKNELDIARKIIEVEKENFDKAQFHAEQARYLAMRAKYIAELVVGFKNERLTDEQMILWYQTQMEEVHSGLPTAIKFDKSNKDLVDTFSGEVKGVVADLRSIEAKMLTKEVNFREVSAMFTPEEAEVVRRGDDLVLRCFGFYFPVGKSDLVSQNFDLLNKIITAIQKFPNSDVEVEGHTDSSGSKKINMQLSEERAKSIADFLIKVAKVEPHRVKSAGLGDDRPIFSNESEEGRSKNRRIEIIIKSAR